MEQDAEESVLKALIYCLSENMDMNFGRIHKELSCFRLEMKAELDGLNGKVEELEKA